MAVALVGWMGCCPSSGNSAAIAAGSPSGGVGGFDRAALQKELSQPLETLEKESTEALRAHVERLGDFQFALELAVNVSPEERRALSEQILTRVNQMGLLMRQRMTEPRASRKSRTLPEPAPGGNLAEGLLDSSGRLLPILGGLSIAFALGYLVRGRRAIRLGQTAARRNSPVGTLAPASDPSEEPSTGGSMTLEDIRKAVQSGRTVLLQTGCEVTPDRRHRFLTLTRETRAILAGSDGQIYTLWEDPSHPNRFYTLLVCRQLEVLDQLASPHSHLSKLAEETEACTVPSGFSLYRAWVEPVPDPRGAPHNAGVAENSLIR